MKEFETFRGYAKGEHKINESDGKGDCAFDRLVYQASSALEQVEFAFLADLRAVARDAIEQIRKEHPDAEGDEFEVLVGDRCEQIADSRYIYNNELVVLYAAMGEEIEGSCEGVDFKPAPLFETLLAKVSVFAAYQAREFASEAINGGDDT